MNQIIERYNSYWNSRKNGWMLWYDYSVFEKIAFSFVHMILALLIACWVVVLFITVPLWIIPYIIYRSWKLNKEEGE